MWVYALPQPVGLSLWMGKAVGTQDIRAAYALKILFRSLFSGYHRTNFLLRSIFSSKYRISRLRSEHCQRNKAAFPRLYPAVRIVGDVLGCILRAIPGYRATEAKSENFPKDK